jgi:hypothetical protein
VRQRSISRQRDEAAETKRERERVNEKRGRDVSWSNGPEARQRTAGVAAAAETAVDRERETAARKAKERSE